MIHHWKAFDLEIIDSNYHHVLTHLVEILPSQISNLKHVEIIKVSDRPTYDTTLERS